ncbi:unnamed protein product [Angiostrongylus costaricensis]|uniref:MIF4G domain-containing protein n=1 Tax=Angiostrongylus costaricensis TaxID=334426 RepID=A0A158PEF7_ANGCS|nr:unnamed protein product [Angiostrongylus costaricensis]
MSTSHTGIPPCLHETSSTTTYVLAAGEEHQPNQNITKAEERTTSTYHKAMWRKEKRLHRKAGKLAVKVWRKGLRVRDSLLEGDSVLSLLQSLCALLNHRGKASLKQNLLVEFFRCMAKHGIPFRYVVWSATSKFLFREEYLEKYIPTMNLELLVKNTILMQLCEILIATIFLGSPNHTSAVVALESRVHRYNKNYENSSVWNAYKLIAEYEEWKKRPAFGGMILNTAQSNAVSKLLSKCPQLLGRVVRFLKAIKLDHEIEVIVAEVCQERDKALSPSDYVWLDWCQPRIEHPERYGKKTEVLSQCANVLFRFLDYGSNRNSTRAWLMLDRAFKFVDTVQMNAIWTERYDWWPQFHVVHLPPEAELRRAELLVALGKVPVE